MPAFRLPTTTGATGGNPEAGRRGAKAWHPDGAGSIDPAGGDAGTATQMGPNILRTQSRVPAETLGASSGSQGTAVHRRRPSLGGSLDLEKFFDRVNHDKLMAAISRRVTDQRILRLIGAFLKVGVLENGLVSPAEEGTPQ